jgi:hypothetical protein
MEDLGVHKPARLPAVGANRRLDDGGLRDRAAPGLHCDLDSY